MKIKKSTLKKIVYSFLGILVFIFILINMSYSDSTGNSSSSDVKGSVTMEGDKQILAIQVRGGYTPSTITAKANTPSVIRFTTANSFDCSTALTISKLNYRNNLPNTGVTDVEVPAQTAGSTIEGVCSMGMYRLKITFN